MIDKEESSTSIGSFKVQKSGYFCFVLAVAAFLLFTTFPSQSMAQACCGGCCGSIAGCSSQCGCTSDKQTGTPDDAQTTLGHITEEFKKHQDWMVDVFFRDDIAEDNAGLLAAMMLMTEQFAANMMQQVQIIGSFFDAKNQLETQQLFQQMTAQAHKDYHPSEELCEVGTNIRSLTASERNTDLSHATFNQQLINRQLLTSDVMSSQSTVSDGLSRIKHFRDVYCNPLDNGGGLENLCSGGGGDADRQNKDVDFTRTIDTPLTLKLDFTAEGDPDHNERGISDDEEDLFALSNNLYAHTVPPLISEDLWPKTDDKGGPATYKYMDLRALVAKRSVAQNSISALAAMKSQGQKEGQPFIYSLLKHISEGEGQQLSDQEIKDYLGERPSYFAQMEMLTKKVYQSPNFYTDLYDKPINVKRKQVAMQAVDLMQKRDIYRSLLRSEMIFSVMLETELMTVQDRVKNEVDSIVDDGRSLELGE